MKLIKLEEAGNETVEGTVQVVSSGRECGLLLVPAVLDPWLWGRQGYQPSVWWCNREPCDRNLPRTLAPGAACGLRVQPALDRAFARPAATEAWCPSLGSPVHGVLVFTADAELHMACYTGGF